METTSRFLASMGVVGSMGIVVGFYLFLLFDGIQTSIPSHPRKGTVGMKEKRTTIVPNETPSNQPVVGPSGDTIETTASHLLHWTGGIKKNKSKTVE